MTAHASAFDTTTPRPIYTAIVKQDGPWWIGWIEEVPGVNCQEASQAELLDSLREALREMLDMNRQDAKAAAGPTFTEVVISL